MRLVFGLVLVVGLGLAGFAAYMVQGYVKQTEVALARERAARAKAGPMVEVFVVNKQLAYGKPLLPEDVQVILWPQNALPEGVFTDNAALFPGDGSKKRMVTRQMEKFEPVLAVKVTEPGEVASITSSLAKGMRAFAIQVDVASGVSGFLRPLDRVDIYWTGSTRGISEAEQGEITRLIETGVRIIAVDQTASADTAATIIARTVTVEATPQQVAKLAQAQATGRLALSLVGNDDEMTTGVTDVMRRDILGIEEKVVAEVEREKVCTIRTRRGAEVVEIPIPCTN
ncbi:Flp pilus assembly protein CpaB [Ruixingdingia sedimenti]|uniref:Flp pilus assembly protein CpaB n=1 Tax=Ruixingdingia sedimenti TaxID=3073604 RepID=A0ABU1F529_9RHOB|nr:Flp pilus assembly protein CpaB [Xinfangfangia sp. LG-4]MDR5651972.1 Flp pilus assembly protein CpaB [Xinfangfangia sp. LG-4]